MAARRPRARRREKARPGSGNRRLRPLSLRATPALLSLLSVALVLGGCGGSGPARHAQSSPASASRTAGAAQIAPASGKARATPGPVDVYGADTVGKLSPSVRGVTERVYVPNSLSNTVDVIDPHSFRIIGHFAVGALPQHITPSWDLRTLYVDNDDGNTLTPIDPVSGRPQGPDLPVEDPYNLYFTPDGSYAIVVAERLQRLDFRDPHTMALHHSLAVSCKGVDHMDFSADGRYLYASCEFAGSMIKVDVHSEQVVGTLSLGRGLGAPQDVKLSPDGRVLYVADQVAGGLWEVDPRRFTQIGFLPTGQGAHGLYPSRDGRLLYTSNRAEGSVSVVSFARRRVVGKWPIPGGSPDMGGVSADGNTLWLSGRYSGEVYAIDTRTGVLRARIKVGQGPHGLSIWPQPGRYSLGHTGNLR